MILNNWYFASVCNTMYTADTYLTVSNYNKLKTVAGTTPSSVSSAVFALTSFYCKDSSSRWGVADMKRLNTSYASYGGAVLGTGTVEPSADDYKLSGDLITTFTSTADVTVSRDDDGITYTALYTITNTGTDDFTIGEIGLYGTSYGSSGTSYSVMVDRTVLDSPVTIAAGGVGQVTYTIRVNYPTA